MSAIFTVEWNQRPITLDFATLSEGEKWVRGAKQAAERIRQSFGLAESPISTEVRRVGGRAQASVWTRHINGWMSFDGREIIILPRYLSTEPYPNAGRLFAQLLSYSGSTRFEFRDDVSADDAIGSPADILANKFIRDLEPAIEQGLPAGYINMELTESSLRGRLSVGRLFPRIFWAPYELPQEISAFHYDIPANRLLRWTCETLSVLVGNLRLHGELVALAGLFQGVPSVVPENLDLHPIRMPPAHAHYQPAIDLASMVAQGRFLTPSLGRMRASGLVFLAWHVFQEYIHKLLREAAGKVGLSLQVQAQRQSLLATHVGTGPNLMCRPDFILSTREGVVAIGDAKYQRPLHTHEPPDAGSVAQVMAAARACNAPCAIIFRPIQPSSGDDDVPRWEIIGTGRPHYVLLYLARPAALTDSSKHTREIDRLVAMLKMVSATGTPV